MSRHDTLANLFAYGSTEPLLFASIFIADVEIGDASLDNVGFTVIEGKEQSLFGRNTVLKLKVFTVSSQSNQIKFDSNRIH